MPAVPVKQDKNPFRRFQAQIAHLFFREGDFHGQRKINIVYFKRRAALSGFFNDAGHGYIRKRIDRLEPAEAVRGTENLVLTHQGREIGIEMPCFSCLNSRIS